MSHHAKCQTCHDNPIYGSQVYQVFSPLDMYKIRGEVVSFNCNFQNSLQLIFSSMCKDCGPLPVVSM